jgi:hypothetical protein
MVSALLVGRTFTVITMAGFQEGRRVGGAHATRMIAAGLVLGASAWAPARPAAAR